MRRRQTVSASNCASGLFSRPDSAGAALRPPQPPTPALGRQASGRPRLGILALWIAQIDPNATRRNDDLRDDHDGNPAPPDELHSTSACCCPSCACAAALILTWIPLQTPPSHDTNSQPWPTRPSTSPVPVPTARAPAAGTFEPGIRGRQWKGPRLLYMLKPEQGKGSTLMEAIKTPWWRPVESFADGSFF